MADFKGIFVNLALAGLVVFAIIALGIKLQEDNSAEQNITDNALINSSYTQLRGRLADIENNATSQRQVFEKENPTITFGALILYSLISAGKIFGNVIVVIFNVLIAVPSGILGIDPVITAVIGGVFISVVILALWYLYKIGG